MRDRYHRGPPVSGAAGATGRRAGWSWRVIVSIRRAYGRRAAVVRHPLSEWAVAGSAATVAIGCHLADAGLAMLTAVVVWALVGRTDLRPARVLVLLVVLAVGSGWRADAARGAASPDRLGTFEGWARVVEESQPVASASRVIVEVEGERFEVWARGRAMRIRVDEWRGGEHVHLRGERRALASDRARRVAWQHVVGELRIEFVTNRVAGGAVDRASNRVRAAIQRGADTLPAADGALFRGLVIGDDRDEPREMIDRFRASGLSHLTAVSGQNVSFLLAAAGPLLRAMRPWWRWAVTVVLIGWFVSLTRFEPSIVRAGTMAAISATAFATGRERAPARLLWLAVTGLLLIDPLLVGSVGFVLSVGATAGVTIVGPRLGARLWRCGVLAMPLGVTVGAQVGVALPALLVFGRLPLVSVPANLLAVPVAGFVMLYGLPAGLVAGAVPAIAPLVMLPCRLGVRWVDTVAALGARLEPGGAVSWAGWVALVAALGAIAAMNPGRHGDPPADR